MATDQPASPSPRSGKGLTAAVRDAFRHPGFLACVVLLATLAVGFEVLAIWKNVIFHKERIDLRVPLDRLDHEKLEPYGVGHVQDLEANVVNSLGTEDYISWHLLDPYQSDGSLDDIPELTDQQKNNWPRRISLFVTYYTGKPDQVPHVPEVCYAGSGHKPVGQDLRQIEIPALGEGEKIPVQVLEFVREGMHGTSRRIVMYTFHANGKFRSGRTEVRTSLGLSTARYEYFSKLEISMDIGRGYSTRQEAVEAGTRFLGKVVPVLLEHHWPDWEAATSGSETPADANLTESNASAEG